MIEFAVNGEQVAVADDGCTLLEALRDRLGIHSPKDGCSPQGQCGCCTVWVGGAPRVACVTPLARVAGKEVTTVEGLPEAAAWAHDLCATGGSQCGFCTPGIVMRLASLGEARRDRHAVDKALLAHLCRCTGWATITEAATGSTAASTAPSTGPTASSTEAATASTAASTASSTGPSTGPTASSTEAATASTATSTSASPASHVGAPRDLAAASRRASIEGRAAQTVAPSVALGHGGFAADLAPPDALVALVGADGEWVVGETVTEARRLAGRVQGRRTTAPPTWPIPLPAAPGLPGAGWARTLQTTWVEPAYLEPDSAWCEPDGEPASSLANGGAFGGKRSSPVGAVARRLADLHGRPVVASFTREDTVLLGPKRPPVAGAVDRTGAGVLHVARPPADERSALLAAIASVAPDLEVVFVDVSGPPVSTAIRASGWAEAAALVSGASSTGEATPYEVTVASPEGAVASAAITREPDGAELVSVRVACGAALDEVVLRSYCIGAAHMALGWVRTEGLVVDDGGVPLDRTIRSFGVLRAVDTPRVDVRIEDGDGDAVNGSDAVFAAVAAAAWRAADFVSRWPVRFLA